VEWLKVKALSSNHSTEKQNKTKNKERAKKVVFHSINRKQIKAKFSCEVLNIREKRISSF
jgi:hypothetical protein